MPDESMNLPSALTEEPPPFTDEDLDALEGWSGEPSSLDHYLSDEDASGRLRWFQVSNDHVAEHLLRRLRELEGEIADADAKAEHWRSEVDAWHQRVTRPLRPKVAYLRVRLAAYALWCRTEWGKKSLKLPSGTLVTRDNTGSRSIVVTDEMEVSAWLADRVTGRISLAVLDAVASGDDFDPLTAGQKSALAGVVRKAVSSLNDDPALRVKVELSAGSLKTVAGFKERETPDTSGMDSDTAEQVEEEAASTFDVVVDGEVVPGLVARAGEITGDVKL